MSVVFPTPDHSVVAHARDAEVLTTSSATFRLCVDSNPTGGAFSMIHATVEAGADGARPHWHKRSAEMLYVLDGAIQVLSGNEIIEAERGDVIVVPPRLPHAFSTLRGSSAELLIVISPGVERFDYFRQLARVMCGEQAPESLQDVQELYDVYFTDSSEWESARE